MEISSTDGLPENIIQEGGIVYRVTEAIAVKCYIRPDDECVARENHISSACYAIAQHSELKMD
jgi:hypothetical protein